MGVHKTPVHLRRSVVRTLKCFGLSAVIVSGILFALSFFLNYLLLFYVGGILFLAPVLVPFISRWLPKEKINPDGKAVFISGCDSGFGHLLAQRLDDQGFHVFAGCLFPEGEGASELRKSGSNRLHVVDLDVTRDDNVVKAAAYVKENLKDNVLWAVVNNAGINEGCEIHWTKMDQIKRVFEVNTMGVIRVTQAFLPKLKESKGRVVTVASLSGRYTFPGMVPYGVSKAAAIGISDGLRLEMYKWGIQCITIEPWMYKTTILNEERIKKNIRRTWASVPEDLKDLYDPGYIDKYIKITMKTINQNARDNPEEVVSLMEEAIMNSVPEYSYSAGTIASSIYMWILPKLPKPVADWCILKVLETSGTGFWRKSKSKK